jgi:hypothetical protein
MAAKLPSGKPGKARCGWRKSDPKGHPERSEGSLVVSPSLEIEREYSRSAAATAAFSESTGGRMGIESRRSRYR